MKRWVWPLGINLLLREGATRFDLRQFAPLAPFCSTFRNNAHDQGPGFGSFRL
jgi:hypothetical protein